MTRITLCALPLLAIFASCSDDPTSPPTKTMGTLTDTLGKQYTVNCGAQFCELKPTDPTMHYQAQGGPVTCTSSGGIDTFILLNGRVLTVHLMSFISTGAIVFNAADPAHPIACVTDADCVLGNVTTSVRSYSYTCVNRICQDVGVDLDKTDILALCQADIPWPTTCPYITTPTFASRLDEIARLCVGIDNCKKIPPSCWQAAPPADAGVPAPAPVDASVPDADLVAPDLDGAVGG